MIFRQLPIAGAFEVLLETHADDRGFFARFYCESEFAAHGLNTNWVQMNLSFNKRAGTLRGLHFQRASSAEVKLVRCLRGQVWDVIVDLRHGSTSYGEHCVVVLDSERRNSIYIPGGFAHGFQSMTDDAELQYFHSKPYSPDSEGGLNAKDDEVGIKWPLPIRRLSDRDSTLPKLKELQPL